jgi:hypothetical protein
MKFIILLLLLSLNSFSAEHRQHQAHQHGSATLAIAFENLTGKIEFRAAAEGIVGFEHAAKSEKDKKNLAEVITKFETEIAKLIQFDSGLACQFKKEQVEMITTGTHADFLANFSVTCNKSPVDSKLTFDFTAFPKIKDLDVTVLAGNVQKSVEVKTKPLTIEIK